MQVDEPRKVAAGRTAFLESRSVVAKGQPNTLLRKATAQPGEEEALAPQAVVGVWGEQRPRRYQ